MNSPLGVPMFPSLRLRCCCLTFPQNHACPSLNRPPPSAPPTFLHGPCLITMASAEQTLCLPPAMIRTGGSNDPDTSARVGEEEREGRQGTPAPLIKLDILGEPSSFHPLSECLGSHEADKENSKSLPRHPASSDCRKHHEAYERDSPPWKNQITVTQKGTRTGKAAYKLFLPTTGRNGLKP